MAQPTTSGKAIPSSSSTASELRKAQKLCDRLGGTGYLDDPVWRPKGMHRKTFERLENRFYRLSGRMNALAAAYFRLP
jgi:hypothetical protein